MRSIASAPDVAPESLFDVPAATAREALELVFRIDEEFGLKPKEVGGELVLAIDPLSKKVPKLAQALKAWLARIDSEKSGEITSEQLAEWKAKSRAWQATFGMIANHFSGKSRYFRCCRGFLRPKSARFSICHPLNLTWCFVQIPRKNAQ